MQKTGRILLVTGLVLLVVAIVIELVRFEYVFAGAYFVGLLIALAAYVAARRQNK